MQLTKDDVEEGIDCNLDKTYIGYGKFLEVRKFYEDYKNDFGKTNGYERFRKDFPRMICDFTEYSNFNDWLFFHCFVEGLK